MDDPIFYCVNEACARAFPRRVAFCPYCGNSQSAPAVSPRPAAPPVPAAAPVAESGPAAGRAGDPPPESSAAPPAPAAAPAMASAVTAWVAPPEPEGRAAQPVPVPVGQRAADAAAPPLPAPIRMRTWLLVALALAAIWMVAKPRTQDKQVEARVRQAIALTSNCKLDAARVELAWLKSSKAKPEQLRRVQSAIGEGGPACEKKRLRGKAWREASAAVEHALADASYEQAEHRLAQFTRRWGDDGETRELGGRIGAARGTLLLDEAEACRRKGDPLCMEQRLAAAEGLNRPELAPRVVALRESLANLLRPARQGAPAAPAAADALASAPAEDGAASDAGGAPAQSGDALPAALESTPPAVAAEPDPEPEPEPEPEPAPAPVRRPAHRSKPPVAVVVVPAPPVRARPPAQRIKPPAKPAVTVAAAPPPRAPRVPPPAHKPKPSAAPVRAAPQLAAKRPAPMAGGMPPALVSRPPAPIRPPALARTPAPDRAAAAPQIFISKQSGMLGAVAAPQYARRLLADAGRDMEQGNYRAAIDKLEICVTEVDAGNRECQALRRRAERLNRDMLRCVANGAEWADEQCQ